MNIRTKLDDYLWKVVCKDFDEEYAYEYLRENGDFPEAACSSIRKGNLWGRNFDYPYDNSVKFMVKNDRTEDRYASHGSAGGFSALTKAFVESGEDSDLYKVLPYMVYDGQNEYGVTANYNLVPTDHGVNYVTAKVSEEKEIPALAIIRFILDNFKSATQAVEYIRDHVSLYFSATLHDQGNELHVMVGDKYKTYCLEFIDGETIAIDISRKSYMTNYHLHGVRFNPDGKVFTPETKIAYDVMKNAYDFNHVTLHGSGLERYNLIVDMYPLIHNEHDMRMALKELYYTRAYQSSENPANPVWYTEFVGDSLTVKSDVSDFVSAVETAAEAYAERSRDTGLTWCTCTSVVYNLKDLSMVISSQEGDVCHVDVIECIDEKIYGEVEFKAAKGMAPQGFRVKLKGEIPAGSDVEINPEDEPTEVLTKLKKDGVTYSVSGSEKELPEYTAADAGKILTVITEDEPTTLEKGKEYALKRSKIDWDKIRSLLDEYGVIWIETYRIDPSDNPDGILIMYHENVMGIMYASYKSGTQRQYTYINGDPEQGEEIWYDFSTGEEVPETEEFPTFLIDDTTVTGDEDDNPIPIDIFTFVFTGSGNTKTEWKSFGTPKGVAYLTTAPTSANTDGDLKFVVLSSEPDTKYNGYFYIITEDQGE